MPVYWTDATKPSGTKPTTQQITRPIGVTAFRIYLWLNLLFGVVQFGFWVEKSMRGRDGLVTGYFEVLCAEIVAAMFGLVFTAYVLIFIWDRRPWALDAAFCLLLFRVMTAIGVTMYAESAMQQKINVLETWYPAAASIMFWTPCLIWSREHWAKWAALPIEVIRPERPVEQRQPPQVVNTVVPPSLGRAFFLALTSWKMAFLIVTLMICLTTFSIAWFCFRQEPSRYVYHRNGTSVVEFDTETRTSRVLLAK